MYTPNANVPNVEVVAPDTINAPANVVVPEVLIVNAANVFPLGVIVPVPTITAVILVYVPPISNIKLLRFNDPENAPVHPVKFNILNQLPVVIVGEFTPDVRERLGALVDVPPVVPKVNVLFCVASELNPPVPVQVNPVAFVISSTATPLAVRMIEPVPNCMALVLALFELNAAPTHVKLKLFKLNVPAVNVV